MAINADRVVRDKLLIFITRDIEEPGLVMAELDMVPSAVVKNKVENVEKAKLHEVGHLHHLWGGHEDY